MRVKLERDMSRPARSSSHHSKASEEGVVLKRPVGTPNLPPEVLPPPPKGLFGLGISPFFAKVLIISIIVHVIVITMVTFRVPLKKVLNSMTTLDVVLVNAKTKSAPQKADVLAQANLNGGGNVDADLKASTPLPSLPDQASQKEIEKLKKQNEAIEKKIEDVMTVPAQSNATTFADVVRKPLNPETSQQTIHQVEMKIAQISLQAQIQKEWEQYQKRPKKTFVGSVAQEYRFAKYIETWRLKVEDIGTRNYPEAVRNAGLSGSLQLTVAIAKDGSLYDVTIDRSSGQRLIDAAALKILQMSEPFARFPPDIAKDTDILYITRTWTFSPEGTLKTRYAPTRK
jgi:protein TonB